ATASFDGTSIIWDAATGEALQTLVGDTGPVMSVVWSPDGKRVLTASRDRTARIWDASTGSNMLVLAGPETGPRINAAWSSDGSQVVTAAEDGRVEVWEVWQTRADLVKYAETCCFLVALTPEERQQFGLPPA